jgi:hypothetical protein
VATKPVDKLKIGVHAGEVCPADVLSAGVVTNTPLAAFMGLDRADREVSTYKMLLETHPKFK